MREEVPEETWEAVLARLDVEDRAPWRRTPVPLVQHLRAAPRTREWRVAHTPHRELGGPSAQVEPCREVPSDPAGRSRLSWAVPETERRRINEPCARGHLLLEAGILRWCPSAGG